jgi:sec-independent protein translocase protein TatB
MIGSLGAQEMMLILVLALIVFGPRKLPDIGKSVGKMLSEFRRASNDFKRTVEQEVEAEKVASRRPTPRLEPPAAGPTPATPTGPAAEGAEEAPSPAEPGATGSASPAASSEAQPGGSPEGAPSGGSPADDAR